MGKSRIYTLILVLAYFSSCELKGSIRPFEHVKKYESSFDAYAENEEIVKFGEKLFFDPLLSVDETVSCANCHHPRKAFTDGNSLAVGIKGRNAPRNSPTLVNLATHPHFMLDGGNATLEIQALTPLRDSNEMGSDIRKLIIKLRSNKEYNELSNALFDKDIDAYVITRALAAFQKNISSFNAPFDQWYYGKDENAVHQKVKDGFLLFDEKLNCTACHTPPYFTNFEFENNGLLANYDDLGRFMVTGDTNDLSKFKVPTLRNITLTAPYLHNGSINSLDELVEAYASGGFKHSSKSKQLAPFELNDQEKESLMFLFESLIDTSFIKKLEPENRF
jgi:cytochrome c peroxidase